MSRDVIDCKHGRFLVPEKDIYVGRSLIEYGEYCENELLIMGQLINEQSWVIDVGANIGAHTIWMAKHAQKVYAFEVQRLVFQILCANIAMNDLKNVWAYHAALGEKAGKVGVPQLREDVEVNLGSYSLKSGEAGDVIVPMIRLDDLQLPRCDLIKIDVEGMECEVLSGAEETIRRLRPCLHVEDDREAQRKELYRILDDFGYDYEQYNCRLYREQNYRGNTVNIWNANVVCTNILCIPKERSS